MRSLRLKMGMLQLFANEIFARLCATQNRYVATLRDPKKVWCYHCDSKWVCCDFVRPKYLRDFARLKKNNFLDFGSQFRVEVCNSCSDSLDPGSMCFDRLESSCLFFDNVRPRKNISTKFDLRKTFRSSRCRRYRLPGHMRTIFHRNTPSELSPP